MADDYLATYLNDHLAGSVVALELLDQLEETHSRTSLSDSTQTDPLPGLRLILSGIRYPFRWLAHSDSIKPRTS